MKMLTSVQFYIDIDFIEQYIDRIFECLLIPFYAIKEVDDKSTTEIC